MGFFSNYYTKPGPGIPKDLKAKKGIKLWWEIFVREFWELIKLNLLYILFCIPIVTIPAATTAMSRITVTMARDMNHFLWTDFIKAFKSDFLKSLGAGVILFVGTFASIYGIWFYNQMAGQNAFFLVPMGICILLAVVLTVMSYYIYPMIALIELPFKQLFKNAAILFLACLPHNALMILIMAVLLFLYIGFFPLTLPVWLVLSFSLFNFITTFGAYAGMRKYVIREGGSGDSGTPEETEEPAQLEEDAAEQSDDETKHLPGDTASSAN